MTLRTAMHFLHCLVRLFFLVFCLRAGAQDNVAAQFANYPFLLRLEHTTEGSRVCVLLRRDGEFHLEHTHGDETQVSEGQIPEVELTKLKEALNGDELQQISQQQIVPPLLYPMLDQLQVNIFRVDHWQNLLFPDATSQISFRPALKPLLAWMKELHDEPHRDLTEDEGKNNCLTPGKIQLTIRTHNSSPSDAEEGSENTPAKAATVGAKPQASQPKSFLMRYSADHFSSGTLQRTCVIVNPAGLFRMEKGSQQATYKMKASVFEGSISEDELSELARLLEASDLRDLQHQNRMSGVRVQDIKVISLSIPRAKGIQQLLFSSYSGYLSGSGGTASVTDDTSAIRSLQKWLKTSIENKKLAAAKSALPNSCVAAP
jgi:hypothetical protein